MKNGRVNAGKTGRPRYFMAGPHAPIIPATVGAWGRVLGIIFLPRPFPRPQPIDIDGWGMGKGKVGIRDSFPTFPFPYYTARREDWLIRGKVYRMALPRDYRNRAILYPFPMPK